MSQSVLAVIPARLESTRLPRKLLLSDTGKPVIQHTWEAARAMPSIDDVLVATDSREIADTVRSFGGDVVTTGAHQTGTERIAEAVTTIRSKHDLVINIQGDEPEITSRPVNALLQLLRDYCDTDIATAATPMRSREELNDPGCVKVVCTHDGRALYFSRAVIPSQVLTSEADEPSARFPAARHIGLYGFRRRTLLDWPDLPASSLERIERLEQLRALQAGLVIRVTAVDTHPPGIDSANDYEAFVERFRQAEQELQP